MARERMTILYDQSSAENALVLGTSNKTELLLGYGTIFGDMASALNPLGDLYKSQVWQLAAHVGVPEQVIRKPPSADLWEGQSDEQELGFAYAAVDRLLFYLVDKRYTAEELVEMGHDRAFVEAVIRRVPGQPVQAPAAGDRQAVGADHRPRVPLPPRLGCLGPVLDDCLGTLFIVGTPIGNLEDLTPRAARVLGEVALVAAEDTRRTRQLLTHLGISKPMLSVHADAERGRANQIIDALRHGDVALCTDAGMPAVSDPGAYLVGRVREAGHEVAVIPGPSAVTAALALSGFSADRFVFLGFLPRKASEMTRAFTALIDETRTTVAFESPYRLVKALDLLASILPERRCAVARELTKVHEELRTGTASELAEHFRRHPPKGEITHRHRGRRRRRLSPSPKANKSDDRVAAEVLRHHRDRLHQRRASPRPRLREDRRRCAGPLQADDGPRHLAGGRV